MPARVRYAFRPTMKTSARWMNDYLDPPASPDEQAELLTRAGLPLEEREQITLPDGETDVRQDIELTSNRGDCLCHVGMAREIAAMSNRTLKVPQPRPQATGPASSSVVKVTNQEKELCPLYTARIIKGVKVGPSPKWLADRLIARGDIPRNNIVDASNFVLFELGQPTHVFDLAKLLGPEIIIRKAHRDELFLPIGEGAVEVKLSEADLVIADAKRAVAIAGVKGGALTAVSDETTDILIEAATFDPITVRNTSRRLGIASDSSYRFERGVHPGQIEQAADRLVDLILELCGGTLCEGVVQDGKPIPKPNTLTMRCDRCRAILGVDISDATMAAMLDRLGFAPKLHEGVITCTVPVFRLDIEREIDLIEEVSRMFGHDNIPVAEHIQIRVAPPQPTEMAKRAVSDALVGMGYLETVTHSLISESAAAAFLPPGMTVLRVSEEKAKAEPALRPSILPSLLRVYAFNRDNSVRNVKLFESGSVFTAQGESHIERVNLAMLHSAKSHDEGVRLLRGAIDRLVQLVLGPETHIAVQPLETMPWYQAGAVVKINGEVLGTFGLLSPATTAAFGVNEPLYAAEIGLPAYYDRYPPETEAHALPHFPAIERDVSAILDERIAWAEVSEVISALNLQHLEALEFVTTFRGKQIGAGRKSLTLRLRFRAADRTLTHEQVNPQMETVIAALTSTFHAEIRS